MTFDKLLHIKSLAFLKKGRIIIRIVRDKNKNLRWFWRAPNQSGAEGVTAERDIRGISQAKGQELS